jgi:guanylate kinase
MIPPVLAAPPVVLSAPSGSGKTSIARALVAREDDFAFSVSATTRPLRGKEVHGVDYWFLSREEFLEMVRRGEFVEWAEVHGELYGTPLSSLAEASEGGRHVILDIDVQGARQIREAVPEALLLFILPPSVPALLSRLEGRGTEGDVAIRRRLATALEELEAADAFDHFIVNDDLERAIGEVRDLVRKGGRVAVRDGVPEEVLRLRAGIGSLLGRDTTSDNQ